MDVVKSVTHSSQCRCDIVLSVTKNRMTKRKNVGDAIHYGDYASMSDGMLIAILNTLEEELERGQTKEFIHKLCELREVERELTLREEDPR